MLNWVFPRRHEPVSSIVPSDTSVTPLLVRFGVFEADLRSGELRRNGIKIKIQDLPFKRLERLATSRCCISASGRIAASWP